MYITGMHRYYKRVVNAFTVPCGPDVYLSRAAVSVFVPFVLTALCSILMTEMNDKIS